jgi:hypothetical protein
MKQKASGIKLVYLYSTIKMMHGPINIKFCNIYADFVSVLVFSVRDCDCVCVYVRRYVYPPSIQLLNCATDFRS